MWGSVLHSIFSNEDTQEQPQAQEDRELKQQQDGWKTPGEFKSGEFQQPDIAQEEALHAAPEVKIDSYRGSSSTSGQKVDAQVDRQNRLHSAKTSFDFEDPEEIQETRETNKHAKEKLMHTSIETIGDAIEYCSALVEKQLDRAKEQNPEMNVSIYGDVQAKQSISTLLPDIFIRDLFLKTTRRKEAWPRVRSLFGVPPYHFLQPEDAGMVRAAGISAGRVNMTYSSHNETVSYSQFGSKHFVDSYMREYRIVPSRRLSSTDKLPCDIDSVASSSKLCMNVRVPKRNRRDKAELLKNVTTRNAVLFPYVGEELTMKYADVLGKIRGVSAINTPSIRVVVKHVVPRSSKCSTAAVLAVVI
jgi:hypothetical protein